MHLLLAAQSARMLAQSAHRGGLKAQAIDYFADADTRRYARVFTISPEATPDQWLAIANRLAPQGQGYGFIYGSGLDTRPRLVEALAQGRTLLGNPPSILGHINQPRHFFALLDKLKIPHPETRFTPPQNLTGWLIKPSCGEGGKGVGFAAKNRPAPAGSYYQRAIPGEAKSVLFLANGEQTRIIGCNAQWTARHDPAQPFLFGGAVNRAGLNRIQRARLAGQVQDLTVALGLVGLNSLDFIVKDGDSLVLELNPRPSATMALYEDDYPGGLLQAHIAACQGQLPPVREDFSPARALWIVFAPRPIQVPEAFRWPAHCADIPVAGTAIATGQPVCSLLAQSEAPDGLKDRLKAMETELLRGMPSPGQTQGSL